MKIIENETGRCFFHLPLIVSFTHILNGSFISVQDDSSDGDDRRIFGGLKFSIQGFFWVGKFWSYFCWVAWFKKGFLGIQNNLTIRLRASANNVQPNLLCFVETFKARKFDMGFFWRVNFWSRKFWGFWFLPPFDHPRHLKFGIPSLGNAQTLFLDILLYSHVWFHLRSWPKCFCSVERGPNARISKRLFPILRTASQLLYQNFARANDPAAGYAGYVPCELFDPRKQIITLSANTMIP